MSKYYSKTGFKSKMNSLGYTVSDEDYKEYMYERGMFLNQKKNPTNYIKNNPTDIINQKKEEAKNKINNIIHQGKTDERFNLLSSEYKKLQKNLGDIPNEKKKQYLEGGMKGLSLSKRLRADINPETNLPETLSQEEIDYAKLNKASDVFYKNGLDTANDYLRDNNLNYKIDPELSTGEGLVLQKPTGKTVVAYRGTDLRNLQDLTSDFKIFTGSGDRTDIQTRGMVNQMNKIRTKYGELPEHITGYSKGGGQGLDMAKKSNIDSTTFNPSVGKRLMSKGLPESGNHKIIRTTTDPVSFGVGLTEYENQDNITVKTYDPLEEHSGNMYAVHKLKNFMSNDTRKISNYAKNLELQKSMGAKLGHMVSYDAMEDGVKAGKTYAETIHEFNSGKGQDTIIENGIAKLAGNRNSTKSGQLKGWLDAGGRLTNKEAYHILDTDNKIDPNERFVSNPNQEASRDLHRQITEKNQKSMDDGLEAHQQGLDEQERSIYYKASEADRDMMKEDMLGNLQKAQMEDIPQDTIHNETFGEGLKGALSAKSLGTGLVAGIGAEYIMNAVDPRTEKDPDGKMGFGARLIGTGALAGAGAGYLAGATVLAPEALAGAGGYFVGGESQKLIEKGLDKVGANTDTKESLSDIGGGALGGATAGAIAGSFVPVVGTAVGAGVGATVGALGGLGSYLIHKFF